MPERPAAPTAPNIPCLRCGYDLINLPDAALCPECAYPVRESRTGSLLATADPAHIRRLRLGALLLTLAALCAAIQVGVGELINAIAEQDARLVAAPNIWTLGAGYSVWTEDASGKKVRVGFGQSLAFTVWRRHADGSSVTTRVDERGVATWEASASDPFGIGENSTPVANPPHRSKPPVFHRLQNQFNDWFDTLSFFAERARTHDAVLPGGYAINIRIWRDTSVTISITPPDIADARQVRIDPSGRTSIIASGRAVSNPALANPTSWSTVLDQLVRLKVAIGAAALLPCLASVWLLTRPDRLIHTPAAARARWPARLTTVFFAAAWSGFAVAYLITISQNSSLTRGQTSLMTWAYAWLPSAKALGAALATFFVARRTANINRTIRDGAGATLANVLAFTAPVHPLVALVIIQSRRAKGGRPQPPTALEQFFWNSGSWWLLACALVAMYLALRLRARLKKHAARVRAANTAATPA